MKRYMLLGYDQYYPCGGMNDFIASFDTYGEAEEHQDALPRPCDYYHIADQQGDDESEKL